MTMDEFLAKPYRERQILVFSKKVTKPTSEDLKSVEGIAQVIVKYSTIATFIALPTPGLASILVALIPLIFKRNNNITYMPTDHAKYLSLPQGDITEGEFYIGHPIQEQCRSYYPLGKFHASMHRQKSHELIRILRSLKVGHFMIKHIQGYKTESDTSIDANLKDAKQDFGASGSYRKKEGAEACIIWDEVSEKPEGPPQLPEDLIWYDYEDEWKLAFEPILNGTLKQMKLTYSYNDDFGVDLKAGLKAAIFKANAKYKQASFQSTKWEVVIEP